MAKEIIKKELVYMDFNEKIPVGKFYYIELLSVGYRQMQVIFNYGSFNNKGRENIIRFNGDNSFKEAKTLFYNKFLEKKAEGYLEKKDIQKWNSSFHDNFFEEHIQIIDEYRDKKRAEYRKTKKDEKIFKEKASMHKCDLCHKNIPEKLFNKINDWARGDGQWDKTKDFIGYKKILCIDCQIEHDIFKKKG